MNEGDNAADAPVLESYVLSLGNSFKDGFGSFDFTSSKETTDPLLRDSSTYPMCQTLD